MTELKEMTREELLEVIQIKDILIKELRDEIVIYEQLAKELQGKISNVNAALDRACLTAALLCFISQIKAAKILF